MTFTSLYREDILKKMSSSQLDVLVIGGGITGCGIALDAVTRGLNTGLVEMQDFAAGTSSRSTKLVHGGLRYLKQFEVKMVAEVGKERKVVYENGPHVTTPEWMLLPLHKGGTFGKISTSIGLRVYDYLAGVKKSERRRMLSVEETMRKEPLIKKEGLRGAGYYVEYRTDDARLTIEVLKEAVNQGVRAVNYAKVTELVYENGRLVGVLVFDQITGESYKIFAKRVVNATGPFVDTLREKDQSKDKKNLRLTKGSHLVFNQSKFPLGQAVYFDTPDGRMIFAIPREGKTYIGTTDTFYDKDAVNPKMTVEDRTYILNAIDYMFPTVKVSEVDIESSWTGVRPLIYEEGKDPSEISRKDEIWESSSGLITIAGGKLTGYRKMSEMIVDLLVRSSDFASNDSVKKKSQTRNMPISGGHVGGSKNFPQFVASHLLEAERVGFTRDQYQYLANLYGSNIKELFHIARDYDPKNKYGLPIDVYVQIVYSIHFEMTSKPIDFFIRRTGALFFNIDWIHSWKKPILLFMANELNWTEKQLYDWTLELEDELHDAIHPI
ncbi:glycerol-3-phosphate dehydrogenase/oxidase [Bacillus sp. DJP31]|uniref:glycerol-3-phosphate dehydrogenase/oxidase n=1 Tax=Bacillus sp. DJP31 TaxID=3409789 RepID=UPI003BB7B2B5